MARIRIDDLPVAENLTPEQEALIIGAGLRSFRPMLEELERREVPAALAYGIDLTDNVLSITGFRSNTLAGNNHVSSVSMNDAGQVVVQRGSTSRVEVNPAEVMKIVYLGDLGRESFTNNTNIQSEFTNMGVGDKYDVAFNLTTKFTDGRLPDSSAVDTVKRGGQLIDGQLIGGKLIGGKNEAPPLAWQGAPADTQSFAVVMKDISVPESISPSKTHYHEILYNIPKGTQSLDFQALPGDTKMGVRYSGPNPPDGKPHTYVYTVYALKTNELKLEGMTPEQMEKAIQEQSIGQTSLAGTFSADVREGWNTSTNAWNNP
jgi:Raf kinase inhibitor-like YbhB/YbcL family protein